ncbi:MAG: dihydroorotase [Gammaproteobacteria bacterium]|nr:dihydroorotase [Gammaproteobacteria bacterium]
MIKADIKALEIGAPDDWHLHLREGQFLAQTVPATARLHRRAIIMPNLSQPVTTVVRAEEYRHEILSALDASAQHRGRFEPLMTLYLTDSTSADEIMKAAQSPLIYGIKLYPQHATTGSALGVSAPEKLHHLYEIMAEAGLPLLVHGETTDPTVDIFDRESVFIDSIMRPIADRHPHLRIVLEHISTRESAEYVLSERRRMMATVTPHHLWLNRNAMFPRGRISPHHYCLPVLKRETHRQALLDAIGRGHDCFAAGTDSAPHLRTDKESSCGCAGIYNSLCALETYAEIFDQLGALDKLEAFVSHHGARFYGLTFNQTKVQLRRQSWTMPQTAKLGAGLCVPFRAGQTIAWTAVGIGS